MEKASGELKALARRVQRRVDRLPGGLQAHIYRVRDIARRLAASHGLDGERAALGMLAHDVARAMADQELLHRAAQLDLPIAPVEQRVPILLHGPVGAAILQREDGLADPSLYGAVRWHTTGHPSLDLLGKVVFLSDKLDPDKIVYYPYLPQLRELAFQDLDRAMLEFLTKETIARASRGELVHPVTIETRNGLLMAAAAPGNLGERC